MLEVQVLPPESACCTEGNYVCNDEFYLQCNGETSVCSQVEWRLPWAQEIAGSIPATQIRSLTLSVFMREMGCFCQRSSAWESGFLTRIGSLVQTQPLVLYGYGAMETQRSPNAKNGGSSPPTRIR